MPDQWTDRLSEYLDGELRRTERAALESHLVECTDCQTILADLRDVVHGAQTLSERAPERDLWPAIANRLQTAPQSRPWWQWQQWQAWTSPGRRFSLSLPQLATAALALMVLAGGATWMLRVSGGQGGATASNSATSNPGTGSGSGTPTVALANFADSQFDAAVADLQRTLEEGRGRLDPQTIEILEKNLSIIDRAIEQARQALASDPANTYLNSHLADARRRKLELLRQATAL